MKWRSALLWRAFFTTAIVAIVLRALIDFCLSSNCGLFGEGGLIMFDVYSESISYHLVDVPPVFILGVMGCIFGSLYNFLMRKALLTKFCSLAQSQFSHPVLFLGCHGLHLADLVHQMQSRLVLQ